jgi:hypothetical protein
VVVTVVVAHQQLEEMQPQHQILVMGVLVAMEPHRQLVAVASLMQAVAVVLDGVGLVV